MQIKSYKPGHLDWEECTQMPNSSRVMLPFLNDFQENQYLGAAKRSPQQVETIKFNLQFVPLEIPKLCFPFSLNTQQHDIGEKNQRK